MRKLTALILGLLGRDPRRGNGAYSLGRRWNDQLVRERRLVEARLDRQAYRLRLVDAQVDAWRDR